MTRNDHRKSRSELIAELAALRRYVAAFEAGDAARESDERYRRLIQFLPEAVCVVCDDIIVYANDAAARLYGVEAPDRLIGRSADDFVPPDALDRVREWRRMLFALGVAPIEEQRRRRVDGSIFYVDATALQIDWTGRPARIVVSRDVTARVISRQALAEAGRRLAAIAENLPGAAYECEVRESGRIVFGYISGGVRDLFGVEPEAVKTHASALLRRIHLKDRRALTRAMSWTADRTASAEVEFRVQRGNGSTAWVRSIARLRRRTADAAVWDGVLIDVTERREALEALRRAKETAELSNRSKSAFLANMSHELRTPLNAVMGFAEVIEREMFGPLGAARYKEYASDIHASGEHLLQLINDILDLSKIEAGKIVLHEGQFHVADVIESSVTLLKQRAEAAHIRLAVRIASHLPQLRADETKIRQVLLNLLANALKYTPAGGEISVTARASRSRGLTISISDTGIGIRPEDLPRVLTPFGQVDNAANRAQRGTGLGLPLAKSLVEHHGGNFELQSKPGKGTTVTVRFPAMRLVA
jgi:PAS domain S-box-containing protein